MADLPGESLTEPNQDTVANNDPGRMININMSIRGACVVLGLGILSVSALTYNLPPSLQLSMMGIGAALGFTGTRWLADDEPTPK